MEEKERAESRAAVIDLMTRGRKRTLSNALWSVAWSIPAARARQRLRSYSRASSADERPVRRCRASPRHRPVPRCQRAVERRLAEAGQRIVTMSRAPGDAESKVAAAQAEIERVAAGTSPGGAVNLGQGFPDEEREVQV